MAAAFVSCKQALENCKKSGNDEWLQRWHDRLNGLVDLIPLGSGLDAGPRAHGSVEVDPDGIRFDVGFHHMNDVGHYDGWSSHTVTIRPAFDGLNVRISGRDRNQIKDHIHEVMEHAFTQNVTWDEPAQRWMIDDDPLKHACANPDCPKRLDGAAEHVDGTCLDTETARDAESARRDRVHPSKD
jgi:hypothetical protein